MKRDTRKKLMWAAAVTLLLAILAITIWRMGLSSANNKTIEALRRAGMPTTRDELNAWYAPVPADKNAALLLTEAMEALRLRPAELERIKLLNRGERLTNAELVRAYVQTNQAAIELIRAALERPAARYSVNFLRGPWTDVEHLEPLRNLARLEDFAALLAAEGGMSRDVAGHIIAMGGLARTLENEPILMSQLARISIVQMAARRFERALSMTKFSDGELLRLGEAFATMASSNGMARGFIGERAMMIPLFDAPAEIDLIMTPGGAAPSRPGAADLLLFPLMRMSGFLERDLQFYLKSMGTMVTYGQRGPPHSLAAREIGERHEEEARRKYYIFSALTLPGSSRAFTREAEALALVRLAETACAIQHFSNARNSLPEQLDELTPSFIRDVALDPCDGLRLRYRRLEDGYLLYSVGGDGRDDGGTEIDRSSGKWKRGPEDIVFRVKTPK